MDGWMQAVLLLSVMPGEIVGDPMPPQPLYDALHLILSLQVYIHIRIYIN